VPEDGQSILDLLSPERRKAMETMVATEGKGWLLPRIAAPPWETIVRDTWGVTNADDVRWMVERLVPTPFGHFKDPMRRKNPAADKLSRTYIRCTKHPGPRFDQHAEMARRTAGWRYRDLPTTHHPAITAPELLTALLLELAS
jgi:hypothetical protein